MFGQVFADKAQLADHPIRPAGRGNDELLFQPRFRLADLALVAVQATAARPRLGSTLHRFSSTIRETRDVGRNSLLLRRAARIAASRGDAPAPALSVRITEAQAASGMLASLIADVLCESALPPGRMELEFCEDSLQTDETDLLYTLAALRDLGVGLVLGGFGSGISSLTVLRRRSLAGLLSGLKLDERLVGELTMDETTSVGTGDGFLKGLISSAHALGLIVLAEGIETTQQHRRLRDSGCDQGIGSWLAPACTLPETMPGWSRWSACNPGIAQEV